MKYAHRESEIIGQGLLPKQDWKQGDVHWRAEIARTNELIELDDDQAEAARSDFADVLDLLESPIEQVALLHMLGRNYAPIRSEAPLFARAMTALPEEWPLSSPIIIVPQVDIGRYRVDFMVHLRNGLRFAVECDGAEFHDAAADTLRDVSLFRKNHLRLLRATGGEIFESPLWTNGVRKMVFTICGFRDEYGR
ncbi:hypothetical protein GR158_12220 [Shinella sp. AETb1-6]|uniref:hypothetical protein n=1 Tax=Shinella sp. AETb1-6 TaxID=2692210 RepID=UPI001369BE1A|nr:hypothetical protein [Shinella sp. AETb1-6]MXN51888.1 hypothetical protein [Shinella sp. AETb1-6]